MKKLSVLLTLFALAFSFNLSADGVKCNTIAEIKALANGTACEYVGNATTTFYYDNYGVMMQDATGAILLYNKNLIDKIHTFYTKFAQRTTAALLVAALFFCA